MTSKRISNESSRKTLRVLLAEDNRINLRVAQKFLERMGHTSVGARDGYEVIDCLKNGPFDIILMDVEMPKLNGIETAERIRMGEAGEGNRRIPIVAMTAHSLSNFQANYDVSKMDEYVSKPVDFSKLERLLKKIVA